MIPNGIWLDLVTLPSHPASRPLLALSDPFIPLFLPHRSYLLFDMTESLLGKPLFTSGSSNRDLDWPRHITCI
jgi:hypothetical protein